MIDTNVIVSRFLSPTGAPAQVLAQWEQGAFTVLVSTPILAEYEKALSYPRIQVRHGLSAEDIKQVIGRFQQVGVMVTIATLLAVVKEDPDDNKFLECAIAGAADYVISGDAHLLKLQQYAGIPILSPAAFLAVITI